MRLLFCLVIFAGLGCQIVPPPTKSVSMHALVKYDAILDLRPAYEFGASHPSGAVNTSWNDFLLPETLRTKSQKIDDEDQIARRLALWGVDKKSRVLILHRDRQQANEAKAIARLLLCLGVAVVEIKPFSVVQSQVPRQAEARENKSYWLAVNRKEWTVAQREVELSFKGKAQNSAAGKTQSSKVLVSSSKFHGEKFAQLFSRRVNTDQATWRDEVISLLSQGLEVMYLDDQLLHGYAEVYELGYPQMCQIKVIES